MNKWMLIADGSAWNPPARFHIRMITICWRELERQPLTTPHHCDQNIPKRSQIMIKSQRMEHSRRWSQMYRVPCALARSRVASKAQVWTVFKMTMENTSIIDPTFLYCPFKPCEPALLIKSLGHSRDIFDPTIKATSPYHCNALNKSPVTPWPLLLPHPASTSSPPWANLDWSSSLEGSWLGNEKLTQVSLEKAHNYSWPKSPRVLVDSCTKPYFLLQLFLPHRA